MLSKIDFTTLKKWVPDYANTTTISNPRNFTATEDGFVSVHYARYSQNSSTYINVKINNVIVAKAADWATDSGGWKICTYDGVLPIMAGQTLTSDAATDVENFGYFIPGKWA